MDLAALQNSVFLQALGSAILNSLWQVFILWLLYETISVSYKNASAKFRNNLSTALLFSSFVWFVTSFVSKISGQQTLTSMRSGTIDGTKISGAHTISSLDSFLSYAGSSLPYLSIAYILLLFVLMAKLFTAYRYVYIISNKRLVSPPDELQIFADKVSRHMEIARKISVWISHHIDVPATIGFIKPVILIPFASLNNLSGDQLEAIILHELSHIKRNDYIINIIVSVIETILFFNPFVVLLSKVIKRERENCCDDFVLQYRYDPHSYALALLRLEQSRANSLKLAIGAISGKKQLLSRIKRITNGQVVSRQFNYGQKLLALLMVTGIICSLAWLSPREKKTVSNAPPVKEIKSTPPKFPLVNLLPNGLKILAGQKENLQAKILKHVSPKKESIPSEEKGTLNFIVRNDDKFTPKEDVLAGYNEDAPLAASMKSPYFYFDEGKLKLPRSINIENFPFTNSSFSIDLSKIDVNKLNERLTQAYNDINAINWNEIQDNIRESFSDVKASDFPSKEQTRLFIENAAEFYKLKIDNQKFDIKGLTEKINKEMRLKDSLNAKNHLFVYENNKRIQREFRKIQNEYTENVWENSYPVYGKNRSTAKTMENDNAATVWPNQTNSSPVTTNNIKISVKHLPKGKNPEQSRKFLQLSFDTNIKKTNTQNVINVEVSNLP
jgi:beta-lactamase regulating signal transducer with metallopeptidase domain